MKSPGLTKDPGHILETQRMDKKVQVIVEGEVIADSTNAIKLFEAGHDPVIYIPKNDIRAVDLVKYDDYHCPYKGDAELLTIKHGSSSIENAAWSYDEPFDEVLELKGRVAFYPNKVQEIRITG